MIIQEIIQDGKLIRQYSNNGYKLLQVETDIEYDEAVDVYPSKYTYQETTNIVNRSIENVR